MKRLVAVLTVLGLLATSAARADEVRVLTAGAFKAVVRAVVPGFERDGHQVVVDNDTVGGVVKRVAAGESFDIVVATPAALAGLEGKGLVRDVVPLARVGIGVAVRDGAPRPDISTVDAFKRTLAAAKGIAYIDPAAGGSSGIYLAGLFEKLGIAAMVRPKAVLVPGGLAPERLLTGEADIALQQISEILPVQGVALVGPLPAEIQNETVYAGAVATGAANPDGARAFLALLTGAETAKVLVEKGMVPAGR